MVYLHTLYGITIESFIPLDQPVAERTHPDVVIAKGVAIRPASCTFENATVCANEREVYFIEKDLAHFVVRDGREIIVDPCDGADQRRLQYVLCSHILPLLLHQRGSFVLHATTLAIHDEAIALLGEPGAGKSTLALALCDCGAAIVADDVTVIRCDNVGAPVVFPGVSHLRLWPDAILACNHALEDLPHVFEGSNKRTKVVPTVPPCTSLPLTRIYRLEEGPFIETVSLSQREAFPVLMGNTYWYGLIHVLDPATHLTLCTAVAARSQVNRLRRPRDINLLQNVADRLINGHSAA